MVFADTSAEGSDRLNMRMFRLYESYRAKHEAPLTMTLKAEDPDGVLLGVLAIVDSRITRMEYDDARDSYAGEILSQMLRQACQMADIRNTMLRVRLAEPTDDIKRLLERFGFRQAGRDMERIAGSIVPPQPAIVPGLDGLVGAPRA